MTTHTDSIYSMGNQRTTRVQNTSLNALDTTPDSIQKLFYATLKTVREGFKLKKWGFDLPDHLQESHVPAEALVLDIELLVFIAKKMGVVLTRTLANEALLVANKTVQGEKKQVKKKPTPKEDMTEQELKKEREKIADVQREKCKVVVRWL